MKLKICFINFVLFAALIINCEKDTVQTEKRPLVPVFEKFDLSIPDWMTQSTDSMAQVVCTCFNEINEFSDFYPYLDVLRPDFEDATGPEYKVKQPWIWKLKDINVTGLSLEIQDRPTHYYYKMTAPINSVTSSFGGYYLTTYYPSFIEADNMKSNSEFSAAVYFRYNLRRVWEWQNANGYLSSLEYFRQPEELYDYFERINSIPRYAVYNFDDTEISNYFKDLLTKTEFHFANMIYTTDGSGNYKFNLYSLEVNRFQLKVGCNWNEQGEGSWKIYDGEQIIKEGVW